MPRSQKLGTAGILLALASIGALLLRFGSPLSIVFATIASVLGALAARQGSKWWLFVPCTIVAAFGFLLYVGFHAD
jgi:hypothetical protein